MIPIVHPDKPTRVTITIGNTIFNALDGGREVDSEWSSEIWCRGWQRGLGSPNPPSFAPFYSTSTKAKLCSQQTRTWTTRRPRRWPDTGSPRIWIRSPDQTRTNRLQPQHPLCDLGHRERPTRGGSPYTGRLPDRHQFGPGDHRARFPRNHSRGSSNQILDWRKDRSGWTSPSPASREDSGRSGINTS